ncbi:MAG TPA: ABC transporter permease [Anaerolineales bacterium]|nr:ABC transporter permease [Anaerolineales bacterium]
MTTQSLAEKMNTSSTRKITVGFSLLMLAVLMFILFVQNTKPGETATFGTNLSGPNQPVPIPDIALPVQPTLYALIGITLVLAVWVFLRGTRGSGWLISIAVFCFVVAFLLWATQDNSFNLVGMLSTTLISATPIVLAALCGVMSERAAVINIAIEGIMLIAAQTAVVSATLMHNLYVGLIVAILTGAVVAAIHAFLVIRFKVDQIVSGTAINIFATGATAFIAKFYLQKDINLLNNSGTLPTIIIPGLSKIPILGPVFFDNTLIFYIAIVLVVIVHVLLFYTPWGLRTRAVGEHPKAADTLGINVYLMRYVNVILGGMIAGVGGAYFTIGSVGRFDQDMTNGKGFIGLAAMIFGNWSPIGAYLASLLFGFADSLQLKMQILSIPIPSEFLAMAPYIVTIIVLTGVIGRAVPPAADGKPYEKQ